MNHYFAPNALEAHIQDISNELVQEKKEFDEAVQLFKDAKTYTTEDRGGSVQNYHYYIYPFKGIALSNFRLLQTLSSHLGKMVAPETEVILTVETDGISVAAFVAASLGLPLVICKPFHYHMPSIPLPQKTGYYERTMYMPKVVEGKKVAIVDCMMSTGGTVRGMIEGLDQLSQTTLTGIYCINNKDNYRVKTDNFDGFPYRYVFDTRIEESGTVNCSLSKHGKQTLWESIDERVYAATENIASFSNVSKNGYQVGAIILDSDTLEIKAWGSRRGDLHAEQDAIAMLKQNCPDWSSRRFTLYSTLEPCTWRKNEGHTACSELIAEIPQIRWVVIGQKDTADEHINGAGIQHLTKHGKRVRLIRNVEKTLSDVSHHKSFFGDQYKTKKKLGPLIFLL
ncbi:MAG TPA: hypothetical protein DCY48_02760 [Candidatus Magasanikbacteria bacterium]|nr:MAG: hypothetical protein A3C10_01285 [Candidatus Magasanikbacteria bacterium RIFCSPHIGHO2_02_FULL_48_18]HAZ28673.1 hypothetical protein [Candidatus Magasanikbacteria bacterium]